MLERPADTSPPIRKQRGNAKPAENWKRLTKAKSSSMFMALRSRHQLVATGLGDQDGGRGGVLLDLLPQPVDVRFQRVRRPSRIVAPDLLQQRLPRHRPLAGAVEIAQDRGLLLGEPDQLVAVGVKEQLRAWPEGV